MAKSNRDRVGDALEILAMGLKPFLEQEMKAVYKDRWLEQSAHSLTSGRDEAPLEEEKLQDIHVLLKVMWEQWRPVFSKTLGHNERSIVSELRDIRNRWAHQESFSVDDTYRALDSAHRLLTAVSAAAEADEIEAKKQATLRIRFDEHAKKSKAQASLTAIESKKVEGLKPWREVITPHPDVAAGSYHQAEFAADLGQVYRGKSESQEYSNPVEFFSRTYFTEGLKSLLVTSLQRLAKTGGDPVIELQTNFGGGKTHALLALYHLASGISLSDLPEMDGVIKESDVDALPDVKRAVLVGTDLMPNQPHKVDGLEIRTMWGELAWQLGGKEGYELVAESDAAGVSPGGALRELFEKYSPCMVLIDEWVAYVRQLYGKDNLLGGTFDSHFSFAQALTESASAVPGVLLLISTPASQIEIGGVGGDKALERIRNVIGRIQSPWQPANAEESFEIVRRRLFEPVADFEARDSVAHAFGEMYRKHTGEFPSECREGSYEQRIISAYPIHPELFDRLYEDWSALDKFQRTRGVLRLMAAVIHSLWENQDSSLLIMPANVPVADASVRDELTRYLEDNWKPVIEKDVDGPNSLPLELDRKYPNLGKSSACRRVARTLYMGSAPTAKSANRGIEDIHIKLGCIQAGERPAVFGDALRHLADNATHVYVEGKRYWLDTQPTITKLARDRAEQYGDDEVCSEVIGRLRTDPQRGEFSAVHVDPESSDVPDETDVRLVILGTDCGHSAKSAESKAIAAATEILEMRGNSPRQYRNMLVFVAPDSDTLPTLKQTIRNYLAWKSIDEESEQLNLDSFQKNQARTKRDQADETVRQQIQEAYQWMLEPSQPDKEGPVKWQAIRIKGQDPIAVKASKKLINQELLITNYGAILLRRELDRVPLWQDDHVGTKQVWEYFAKYLYLPRLKGSQVFVGAVQGGLDVLTWAEDTFAYASGYDQEEKRYLGLCGGSPSSVIIDSSSLIVKPEVAQEQLEREKGGHVGPESPEGGPESPEGPEGPELDLPPKRFHGVVSLETLRVGRDAGEIAENVIQFLENLPGAEISVILEIQACIPDGVPDDIVRTVTENARTLKFDESSGFEEL